MYKVMMVVFSIFLRPIKSILKVFLVAGLAASLVSCGDSINANDPTSAARSFWNHALSKNPENAKPFMVEPSVKIGIKGFDEGDTAELGGNQQQDGIYFIHTTVRLVRNGKVALIPMRTVVRPVDGMWRVDYWSTKQSVIDAALDNSMKWFATTLSNANLYVDDLVGAEDQKASLKFAEQRMTEEFESAKKSFLDNYAQYLNHKAQETRH